MLVAIDYGISGLDESPKHFINIRIRQNQQLSYIQRWQPQMFL